MPAPAPFVGGAAADRTYRTGLDARRGIRFDHPSIGALMSKILFAVAALVAATAVPVSASIPHDSGIRVVRYADLDLSSAAGRDRLEQRIGAAVRAVCGFG